ncbi:MAG: 1,2-phenylacetyl-CoA epoxidase subunit PaaD [Burkholderiales bacterium]
MTALSVDGAWAVLQGIADPEIPVISICDLGIVRDVRVAAERVEVVVTPTYSGCPATEMIESCIREALAAAGASDVRVERQLSPAWSTDWLAAGAAERLRGYGIAPPGPRAVDGAQVIRFVPRCPRCDSHRTERLSAFGATACKSLHRCVDCREPFEYFKPL